MPCPVAGHRAANAKKDRQTNGTVSVIAMSYPTAFWYPSWPPSLESRPMAIGAASGLIFALSPNR